MLTWENYDRSSFQEQTAFWKEIFKWHWPKIDFETLQVRETDKYEYEVQLTDIVEHADLIERIELIPIDIGDGREVWIGYGEKSNTLVLQP